MNIHLASTQQQKKITINDREEGKERRKDKNREREMHAF